MCRSGASFFVLQTPLFHQYSWWIHGNRHVHTTHTLQQMICIECTQKVDSLYTQYSSENIQLTACPNCNRFADKYIEHDGVVITIDLLLLKPQAFRHMVFNVLTSSHDLHSLGSATSKTEERLESSSKTPTLSTLLLESFHPQTLRITLLVTLFDVYLRWARAEKTFPDDPIYARVLNLPVLYQYLIFVVYCLLDALVAHVVLQYLARVWLGWKQPYSVLSTALLISSSAKLFPILTLIWSYDLPMAAQFVGWSIVFITIETLAIILGCNYFQATLMTLISWCAQSLVCDGGMRLVAEYA